MFVSLIKLIFLFIFIYFIISVFKMIYRIKKSLQGPGKKTDENKKDSNTDNKTIELNKDQYKVE